MMIRKQGTTHKYSKNVVTMKFPFSDVLIEASSILISLAVDKSICLTEDAW